MAVLGRAGGDSRSVNNWNRRKEIDRKRERERERELDRERDEEVKEDIERKKKKNDRKSLGPLKSGDGSRSPP